MSADEPAGGQSQSLGGRIHRHIGWQLVDVEALEVLPHRMRGVGETAVREGIPGQEIAELVVLLRARESVEEAGQSARDERGDADPYDRAVFVARKGGETALHGREHAGAEARGEKSKESRGPQKGELNDQQLNQFPIVIGRSGAKI